MLFKLATAQSLREAAIRISKDKFYPGPVYNGIVAKLKGLNDFEFYVPEAQPNGHTIFMIPVVKKNTVFSRYIFHSIPEESDLVLKFYKETSFIDWNATCIVDNIPDFMVNDVENIMKEKGCSYFKDQKILHIFPENNDDSVRIPAGFEVHRLNRKAVEALNDSWYLKEKGSFDFFLRNCQLLPSVCIYSVPDAEEYVFDLKKPLQLTEASEDAEPVAWVASASYGCIGLNHTKLDYRKQGLMKLITYFMPKIVVQEGFMPHGYTLPENREIFETLKRMADKYLLKGIYNRYFINYKNSPY